MPLDNVLKKGQTVVQRYIKKFCKHCILFFLKHFENGIRALREIMKQKWYKINCLMQYYSLSVPYKYVKE